MDIVLLLLALVGHGVLWVGLLNRIHATSLSRSIVRVANWSILGGFVLIPVGFAVWLFQLSFPSLLTVPHGFLPGLILVYMAFCWLLALVGISCWTWNRFSGRTVDLLWSKRKRLIRLACRLGKSDISEDHEHHFLAHLPGNQILEIDFTEHDLRVARLDPQLDGLSIIHMSDLHFTGRIGKAFFHEVVALSNEIAPDMVALTGDLVDAEECIDWIPEVLGSLVARHGVFFVLGNHDRRVNVIRLRQTLCDAGLVDLGGCWTSHKINGSSVLLAGNELPWFPPAADMQSAPPRESAPLRILLSHSPDQLGWAVAHDFDLMLAGHLHGGQIRLPLIGPILSPSRQGVRFASGIFHRPPTILHVSRGLSGELPIRVNCPPELTRLTLHPGDA